MTNARGGGPEKIRRRYAPWLVADVTLIALFAVLGHFAHYGSLSPTGVVATALPFLVAYGASTALLRPWRTPLRIMRPAVQLWVATAAGGLLLRVLLGEGAELPFQIVALVVLGLFLLIPRGAAALILSRRRRAQSPVRHSHSRNEGAAT